MTYFFNDIQKFRWAFYTILLLCQCSKYPKNTGSYTVVNNVTFHVQFGWESY